ncbi:MAG TPA: ABC transporter permease [Gemmatimonadales bacterium]|jgi:putative ABC transport system permease protein
MTLLSSARLAWAALRRNTMRSLLTTLGIVIGVAAVVMMQSMGRGATAYVGEAISGLGSNMLFVVPGASSRTFGATALGVPLFTTGDLDAIHRLARDVGALAAANARVLRAVAGGNNRATNVAGVTPGYFDIRQWGVARGRLPSLEDERQAAPVCVIGHTVSDELFAGQDPIGHEIRVHDVPCRVIGVLEEKGAAFGADRDDVLFMPYATFSRRLVGGDRVGYILAAAIAPDRIDAAREEIAAILRQRRHVPPGEVEDFAVRDPREIEALLDTVTGILTALLAGVAGISLVVGGIGIMNIMLVSVTERTREIGIRLAVGARGGDILAQFLVEATILSALGGLIGIGVGLAGAFGVARVIHVPYIVPGVAMPVAFGVSVLVGIGFGVFPARKASQLNPLAALRFE